MTIPDDRSVTDHFCLFSGVVTVTHHNLGRAKQQNLLTLSGNTIYCFGHNTHPGCELALIEKDIPC